MPAFHTETLLSPHSVLCVRERTVLTGVKAGDGSSQDLHEVSHAPQVLVHVSEVSVDVVSVPETRENNKYKNKLELSGVQSQTHQNTTDVWNTNQSRGSFFMRRLSLGK